MQARLGLCPSGKASQRLVSGRWHAVQPSVRRGEEACSSSNTGCLCNVHSHLFCGHGTVFRGRSPLATTSCTSHSQSAAGSTLGVHRVAAQQSRLGRHAFAALLDSCNTHSTAHKRCAAVRTFGSPESRDYPISQHSHMAQPQPSEDPGTSSHSPLPEEPTSAAPTFAGDTASGRDPVTSSTHRSSTSVVGSSSAGPPISLVPELMAGGDSSVAPAAGSAQHSTVPALPEPTVPDRDREEEDAAYAAARPFTEDLSETERQALAAEWGYDRVGVQLPAGAKPELIAERMPKELFQHDPFRAWLGLLAPLAVMVAAYAWLWSSWGICPWWQALACWGAIGTAYTGLFAAAHECAHFAFLPGNPLLQDVLGATLMAPSLYSFESWRLRFFQHLAFLNVLNEDTGSAWHPLTVRDVEDLTPLGRAITRLLVGTPLKLLSSIGHWWSSWDGLDLKRYHAESRRWMLLSWLVPVAFVGLVWPAMVVAGGVAAWASCWLAPWLVFHVWLSLLTLVQHTAPHIPFRPYSMDYDMGQSVVSGTVVVHLPQWLELLLNNANYHLHQYISVDIPFYHAHEAHEWLQARLGTYTTETTLNLKLITNLITKWQVYDTSLHTYRELDTVLKELDARQHPQEAGQQSIVGL